MLVIGVPKKLHNLLRDWLPYKHVEIEQNQNAKVGVDHLLTVEYFTDTKNVLAKF